MSVQNITDWHADYSQRSTQWTKIRDALDGEDKIKDQGEAYLPKPSGMNANEYKAYKQRATFYAVAERTLRGLSGMVFRHVPILKVPDRIKAMQDSLTTDGYSFEVLTEEILREVLSVGRYGMLLDFPSYTNTSTQLPYIATYFAEDIINWEQEFDGGMKVLTRVVLRDDIDNTFGQDAVRFLELVINDEGNYEVRKWEAQVTQTDRGSKSARNYVMTETVVPTVNGKPLKRIPFFFVNPYDLRPDIEKPPMLDLVNMNVSHYRNSADYEHALYLTAQPTPWISGQIDESKKPKSIGSGTIWYLPENATAGMLEFSGAGIAAQRTAMEDKEGRMAALGARMIHEARVRNETSDTARMRGRGELSLLTNAVNMTTAALERVFQTAAEWSGSSTDEVEVKINKDWVETRMDANELTSLVKAWQSGAISRETMHENLQRGEIMSPYRSWEDERDAIEEEGGEMGMTLGQAMRTAVAPTEQPAPGQEQREAQASGTQETP